MYKPTSVAFVIAALVVSTSCTTTGPGTAPEYDVIIRGGDVYDGSGAAPVRADVGVRGDQIATIGDLSQAKAASDVDARGLAVAPGFINMLSWATESLLHDPKSQSDIRQGVTLEVMGEGESMGPLNPSMKKMAAELQADIKYPISWTTLGEYLAFLEKKGTSTNVASFVGATTVRIHELGYADRPPTPEELGPHARAGSRGHGRGRARRRVVAHLRPGVLRKDGRIDRAL